MVTVAREPANSPDARRLCDELDEDLERRYPGEEPTHFDSADGDAANGSFLIARDASGAAVGCVALRLYEPGIGEVKRMYVVESWRGRGLGRRLLEAIEAEARRIGYPRVILEAGAAQPEAMALYERAGYHRIPAYGQFADNSDSVCYAKSLS